MGSKWFNSLMIALALLLSAPLHAAWQSVRTGTLPGKRLPPLALVPEAGAIDGVVLIGFSAPGCTPCQQRIPLLNTLQATYQAQGLTVIGMARAPPTKEAAHPVGQLGTQPATQPGAHPGAYARHAAPGYVVRSDGGELFAQLGVRSLPYAVLVDRNGIVAWQGDPSELSRRTLETTLAAPRLGELMRF